MLLLLAQQQGRLIIMLMQHYLEQLTNKMGQHLKLIEVVIYLYEIMKILVVIDVGFEIYEKLLYIIGLSLQQRLNNYITHSYEKRRCQILD